MQSNTKWEMLPTAVSRIASLFEASVTEQNFPLKLNVLLSQIGIEIKNTLKQEYQ